MLSDEQIEEGILEYLNRMDVHFASSMNNFNAALFSLEADFDTLESIRRVVGSMISRGILRAEVRYLLKR